MRRMRGGFAKYSLPAALAGVGLLVSTSLATAQTITAGNVTGTAGQTASVPITIDTGSSNVAFFGVTFTVVAQGGAPAVTTAMDYTSAVTPGPDLKTAVAAQAKLAIGYAGATIDPPLSGSVMVGTLSVPIPAGATGSYQVQLSKVSAGDSGGNKVTLTATNGTISLGGAEPTLTPTTPAGPGPDTLSAGSISGQAGQTAAVPITINTGTNNVAFFGVTFTVVAQGGITPVTTAMDYTSAVTPGPDLKTAVAAQAKLAIGYAGATIDPPLTGTVQVGTLMVPIPAGVTSGIYEVQLSKISAGDSGGNKVTLTGVNGSINIGGVTPPTSTPTQTQGQVLTPTPTLTNTAVVATQTPTNTQVVATATATRTPIITATITRTIALATRTPTPTGAAAPSPFDEDGGCQINSGGSDSAGWLLLFPAIGLLVLRRRRR
ncbi:MAG TPA: MYXO-CTERM sorting domain-containing protein [Candidatus Margulisiibacteriota bacterium]|nr:MYXO-CTERM sorting domain-containing protein [Candidatus Margulisiibacteriota bacterium]